MKKRMTAFLLALCLMVGFVSAITPTASAASVTADDMASLASAAQQAIGSSAADLGLPAGDWCGYFVGNRMNNSQIAAKLGTTPYSVCAYAISLVSWICATKDAGVFYVASPVHQNRLLEIDPRLGENGRMVARTSSGWSPLPGDILQFSWSNWNLHTFDHTGIVVSVSGDIITYVDGNGPSGLVAAHTIRKDSSTIFGHIRFNTDSALPSSNPPEYFDCNVMIYCVNGQVVNLYNNPGDSAKSDYFNRGQAARSTYGVKMNDGSTWYQISATSLGVDRTFWLKYESGKMTIADLQPQPTPCSHNWDAGVETVSPTVTTSGMRTYTCTVCGETKSEPVPAKPAPDRIQVTLNLGTLKTNNLDRFKSVKTYSDGIFLDVDSDAWYRDNVAAAYELGLMKGTGQGAFEPGKNVTIAETITLVARLHSTYYADGAFFESYDGGNWYDPYVNYAKNNGLLPENYDYSRPATREEFVHLLARALPNEALPAIKTAPAFDDAGRIVYSADVELLSQAGIITGNGSYFLPKNPITRAEVAAVVTRMAKAELRKG